MVALVLYSSCDINEEREEVATFLGLTLFLLSLQPGSQRQAAPSSASRGGQVSVCTLGTKVVLTACLGNGWHWGGVRALWGWNCLPPRQGGAELSTFSLLTPACLRSSAAQSRR